MRKKCPSCSKPLLEVDGFMYCSGGGRQCHFVPVHRSVMAHVRHNTVKGRLIRFKHQIINVIISARRAMSQF
jgi:uncharacterized Zn finger protein (UPF0148 family)